ncbi:MAG: NAD(P)/FAD-dependent oxidoreductase, partial [Candidatus Puniceispirillaceae bacterium]
MKIDNSYDLVIVGSGPAGMSAAVEATKQKMKALVLDDQSSAGGQVYRNVIHNRNIKAGLSFLGKDYWFGLNLADEFESSSVEVSTQSRVWQISEDKKVFFSRNGKAFCVQAKFVLIATGAMERPMPIPGWTLPGVMSVGAAQTLLKTNSSGAD